MLPPEQYEGAAGVTVTEGPGVMLMVTESFSLPHPLDPVTTYFVVAVAVAITVAPVVLFNPVAGDQV